MAWAPDYVTVTELSEFVRVPDTADDGQLALAIAAASRAVDQECRRQFGVTDTETRAFTACFSPKLDRWVIEVDDYAGPGWDSLEGVVSLDTDGDGEPNVHCDPITLGPPSAAPVGFPFTRVIVGPSAPHKPTGTFEECLVTGRFGWVEVPPAVRQATLLQASRFLARRDSPFGVAGAPTVGSELRLLAKVDPDVAVTLRPFRRPLPRAGAVFA